MSIWRRRRRKARDADSRLPLPTMGVPAGVKSHIPTSRSEWLARTHLARALATNRNARLILISAPAGFGKTTLIAVWHADAAESRPFAWVSVDSADNDPVSLWTAIVASLDQAISGLNGERLIRAINDQTPDVEGVLLPRLLNALAARHEHVVLVLDDYHVLDEPRCHRQIKAFVDRLPPTVQLVIATRTDPGLPVARYRAAGEVVELGMRDLRFTRGEAALLVRRIAGMRLRDADLHDLLAHTEGWPAAIYLAALSLRDAPDPAAFIRDFAGTNRLVVDYLSEEVLRPQPIEVRRFLLRTSILDRFTARLCNAVAGTVNAADLLVHLERSNLFLIPLDDNRTWYRYHHLFRDALRGELARDEPDLIPVLHLRASTWFDRHHLAAEAIGHGLAAGDRSHAADVFTRHWLEYVNAGRMATVRGWIDAIGAAEIGRDAVSAICAAWTMGLSGDRHATRHWLTIAESLPHEGPLPDGSPSIAFSAALLRAIFGFDGVPAMLRAAETAVALGPEPTSRWYALARVGLGYGHYLNGDLEAAIVPLEEAARSEAALPTFRILALSILSLTMGEIGRCALAGELARAAHELAENSGLTDSSTATLAFTALGAVLANEGRFEDARRALEHALNIRRRIVGLSSWPTLNSLVTLARLSLDTGDRSAARALLGEARDLVAAEVDSGAHIRSVLAELGSRLAGPTVAGTLSEPLTKRELAVLRLLRGDLSQREIGRQLYVSANTIKTHTRAIYRKLGASSREEAINRARDLGIL